MSSERSKVNWFKYLTPEFKRPKESIRQRERVVVTCISCSQTNVVIVANLITKVIRSGTYSCFSCSARASKLGKPSNNKRQVTKNEIKI